MRLVLASLMMVAVGGCNSGLDQQSAAKVMSSALTGTATAQAQFKPTTNNSNASFDGDIQNPAGTGSAHVTGSAVQSSSGWDVKFDISFNQWTDLASNVTLNGALHETASFTTMSPFVGNVAITGSLAATGAVQSSVDFDVAVDYSPTRYDVVGHVGGASINASVNL